MHKLLPTLCLPLLLAACATAEYKPFEGTSPPLKGPSGVFVDTNHSLPIYTSAPPKEFVVIGKITLPRQKLSAEAANRLAVRTAREHGADGLINVKNSPLYGGTLGGFAASPIGPHHIPAGSAWSSATWLEQADYLAIQFVR